ncbi:alpha/beta fold hydrolase [Hyphococcus sp.]|uniref:alpha/beta fold hydrolase n=1 Tax=Hyphococcus sp. TaxID=2038636 RepID=UPI003CCC3AD0
MTSFDLIETSAPDKIVLRARRYAGGSKTPVLCIPGLTRNARDFEDLAPKIAKTGRDVIAVTLRGRADSDYDADYLNYHPLTYRDDILHVLDTINLEQAIFLGTSLGGIVTMLVNAIAQARVSAAVINDVGPELAPEGLSRIGGYVGGDNRPAATLEEAAARIKEINEVAFPGMDDAFWIAFAKRTYRKKDDGRWVLDYDPNIGRALTEVGPAPDLWPAWESLNGTPTLVVRGEISDLLSPEIIEKMRAVHPSFEYTEVPNVGHAPMLTEPAAWRAIQKFLQKAA